MPAMDTPTIHAALIATIPTLMRETIDITIATNKPIRDAIAAVTVQTSGSPEHLHRSTDSQRVQQVRHTFNKPRTIGDATRCTLVPLSGTLVRAQSVKRWKNSQMRSFATKPLRGHACPRPSTMQYVTRVPAVHC
jgi:hypothetical protein